MWTDLEARLPRVGHDTHDASLAAAADNDDDGFRPFTIVVREGTGRS